MFIQLVLDFLYTIYTHNFILNALFFIKNNYYFDLNLERILNHITHFLIKIQSFSVVDYCWVQNFISNYTLRNNFV